MKKKKKKKVGKGWGWAMWELCGVMVKFSILFGNGHYKHVYMY